MATINGTSASETLQGTSLFDWLYGRGGNDILFGYAGDDFLVGGSGNDTMRGGAGNDTYYVDSLSDQVIEAAGEGVDTIRASGHYQLAAGESIERLTTNNSAGTTEIGLDGNEFANVLVGNDGINHLRGHTGNDTLSGRGGEDILTGGGGRDRLIGGSGADIFVFIDTDARDVISDFESGIDKIDLGWFLAETEFNFIGSANFSGQAGEGRHVNGLFLLDIDGDRAYDLSIAVAAQVAATDFDFSAHGYWDY